MGILQSLPENTTDTPVENALKNGNITQFLELAASMEFRRSLPFETRVEYLFNIFQRGNIPSAVEDCQDIARHNTPVSSDRYIEFLELGALVHRAGYFSEEIYTEEICNSHSETAVAYLRALINLPLPLNQKQGYYTELGEFLEKVNPLEAKWIYGESFANTKDLKALEKFVKLVIAGV